MRRLNESEVMIAFRKVLAYLYALCFMLMSVLAAFTIVQGTTVFDNLSTVLNVVSLVLTFSTGVTFGLGAWNLFMVALGRPYHEIGRAHV